MANLASTTEMRVGVRRGGFALTNVAGVGVCYG